MAVHHHQFAAYKFLLKNNQAATMGLGYFLTRQTIRESSKFFLTKGPPRDFFQGFLRVHASAAVAEPGIELGTSRFRDSRSTN